MFTMEHFFNAINNQGGQQSGQFMSPDGSHLAILQADPGLYRPYRDERGHVWVDVTVGRELAKGPDGEILTNAAGDPMYRRVYEPQRVQDRVRKDLPVMNVNNATSLPRDAWLMLDRRVIAASRKPMQAWADLRTDATFSGFDGMASPVISWERTTDPGVAQQSIEVDQNGSNFAPKYDTVNMPLPITYARFELSSRFAAQSAAAGTPADTQRGEIAARRIGEFLEQQTIGIAGYDYGGDIPGYLSHGDRITKTDLTSSATATGETILADILAMIALAEAQDFYGPYRVYLSSDYGAIIREDFKAASDKSARSRLLEEELIASISTLRYQTADTIILKPVDSDVADAVVGQEIMTVQWPAMGPFRTEFVVMTIAVPRIKARFVGQTATAKAGIVHGS